MRGRRSYRAAKEGARIRAFRYEIGYATVHETWLVKEGYATYKLGGGLIVHLDDGDVEVKPGDWVCRKGTNVSPGFVLNVLTDEEMHAKYEGYPEDF